MPIPVISRLIKPEIFYCLPITVQVRLLFMQSETIKPSKATRFRRSKPIYTPTALKPMPRTDTPSYRTRTPRNAIYQFHFDEKTGMLTQNIVGNLNPGAPIGPRHFCFHPSKPILYFSNENGSSVSAYTLQEGGDPSRNLNGPTGRPLYTPPLILRKITPARKSTSIPHGELLYVSNRGHDSIAGFAIDEETGKLSAIGHQLTEPTPRVFNIDGAGNFLFVGGQGSGNLATYRINRQSGELLPLDTYAVGENPMWVLFV